MKLGIAAIFKNELDYVLEWIAYHRLIGVNDFFVADNVSDDGTSELLESLDQLKVIKRVYFPRCGDDGPQMPAYNHILKRYGGSVDLLCYIDADEFIVNTNGLTLKDNLSEFKKNKDAGAMALNWRNFGSSGNKFKEEGLVIERFTQASLLDHDFNRHIKTILKPSMVERMHVHECILRSGNYYSSNMKPSIFENGLAFEPKTKNVLFDRIRINHYVVKSRQEHMANKERKGSGAGSLKRSKGASYFKAHDLNDEFDGLLIPFVDDVKRGVDVLKASLVSETPYLSYGRSHVDVSSGNISGWAVSEFDGPLKIRLLINDKEFLVDVNRRREDVVRKGISRHLKCGFSFAPPSPLSEQDKVEVFIYGTNVKASLNFKW
ncbi:glycosyltransferase family 2 protein [Microbulbifer sp. SSSA002]|uniref:glycosyltransferase family 2 protein n=1 Tax=Microbulbifer sp. SSSA002 TaxID=3243376 RepID=UPI0040393B2C